VWAPYFVNLNNNTFQSKTLLFFVHLRSQQKRTKSHLQLSNLQYCHFDIVILRVAIISNHVQNVHLIMGGGEGRYQNIQNGFVNGSRDLLLDFLTASIALERLKLETSNLAHTEKNEEYYRT